MDLRRPITLELVRHAQSEANVEDLRAREAGAHQLELARRDADVELSPLGEQQARALGEWFAQRPAELRPEVVLCSPYRRAVATAQAAVGGGDLGIPIRLDERLRERELGVFDGLTTAGVRQRHPQEAERLRWVGKFYYRPPGGESWCDVALRVRSLLDSLTGARVLIVSHQAVIMTTRYILEGLTEAQVLAEDAGSPLRNCALTRYVRDARSELALDVYDDYSTMASMGAPVTAEPSAEESNVAPR